MASEKTAMTPQRVFDILSAKCIHMHRVANWSGCIHRTNPTGRCEMAICPAIREAKT